MADIISDDRKTPALCAFGGSTVAPAIVSGAAHARDGAHFDVAVLPLVELLFFAYRALTSEADAVLNVYGLGRAHHRVLHFVYRNPGLRVADLLELLKITKQSLGRVLRKLVDNGWIEQAPGAEDRRERRLTLTAEGRRLASELAALQTRTIDAALSDIETSTDGPICAKMREFLFAMISRNERAGLCAVVCRPTKTADRATTAAEQEPRA